MRLLILFIFFIKLIKSIPKAKGLTIDISYCCSSPAGHNRLPWAEADNGVIE
ncbi:MAG: hypothetical protein JWP78_556 [Mucilaginibacter sp.]|nr:hypothetical protein [Mucilaginibacter sp.]